MRIDVLTLFPEVLQPHVTASIIGRAQHAGIADIHLHQLRDYSTDPHRKVDDRPFGGGPGMVLMCQPVCDAVAAIEALDPRPALRVLLTPQGRTFNQAAAQRLATHERLLLICGHYEGFDERILDLLQPLEISLGDFVMTGGEIAAAAVIDAVVRLLPGALGHEEAALHESFQGRRLDHPQYTRPRAFRGLTVPEVLLGGNHAEIAAWRRAQSEQRTRERRPDLLAIDAARRPAPARSNRTNPNRQLASNRVIERAAIPPAVGHASDDRPSARAACRLAACGGAAAGSHVESEALR
ncbi:MAG: tRNA (guanosine(37)-N1)-methyltransferase TrmD [Phycisphaerae bacterium]|jgi:tRNA (guanine37-N1)-methyltransferase|nr:tRNA (guanosine(37)-N1)-methyltransferase TrmD [Phycisphaerae bacterium]MCZ2399109.1 tRNA (guanosine(37)-N1)-methyltransferase TrmD [Phycisphaerae bacterium]